MKSPIGDKLHQGVQIIQTIQHNYYALAEGDTDLKTSSIRVITTLTFAILRKIGEGKTISAFSTQDWKELSSTVSQYAILDVQKYSVFARISSAGIEQSTFDLLVSVLNLPASIGLFLCPQISLNRSL